MQIMRFSSSPGRIAQPTKQFRLANYETSAALFGNRQRDQESAVRLETLGGPFE